VTLASPARFVKKELISSAVCNGRVGLRIALQLGASCFHLDVPLICLSVLSSVECRGYDESQRLCSVLKYSCVGRTCTLNAARGLLRFALQPVGTLNTYG